MTKTKHRFPFVGQHAPFVRIGFGTSGPATGPTITAAGSLSGTEFKVGVSRTITAGTATETGGGTVTYEYQWLVAGASAASTAAYSPASGDYGDSIAAQWRAVETGGTNDGTTGWQTVGSGTVAGIAPVASTAPSISSATPAPGDTVTITEGTYTGTPAPTITGVLTLGGVDVTADMVGLDYTIPGGTADSATLLWSETASNGVSPDATASASATVTVSAVTVVPITVDNSAGALTTNAQVLVTLPYVAGMQADYSDIRFLDSDGTTEIPFWLESKTDGTTADFWVSIPSLPASTKTLYYSYGNAAVSASDGATTFDFFDGFESGVSGWTPSAASFTVAQDATRAKRGSYSMLATQTSSSPSAQASAPYTLVDNVYECDLYDDAADSTFFMVFRIPGTPSGAVGIGVYAGSSATNYVYHHSGYTYVVTSVARSTGWHKFGIALDGAGGAEFFIDGVSVGTQTGQLTAANSIYFAGGAPIPTSTNVDDVRVRKLLSPVPTVTLGSTPVSIVLSSFLVNTDGTFSFDSTSSGTGYVVWSTGTLADAAAVKTAAVGATEAGQATFSVASGINSTDLSTEWSALPNATYNMYLIEENAGGLSNVESTSVTKAAVPLTVVEATTNTDLQTIRVEVSRALNTAYDTTTADWTPKVNGTPVTMTSAAIDTGATTFVTVVLSAAVVSGDDVTIDYSGTNLRANDDGTFLTTFTAEPVGKDVTSGSPTLAYSGEWSPNTSPPLVFTNPGFHFDGTGVTNYGPSRTAYQATNAVGRQIEIRIGVSTLTSGSIVKLQLNCVDASNAYVTNVGANVALANGTITTGKRTMTGATIAKWRTQVIPQEANQDWYWTSQRVLEW